MNSLKKVLQPRKLREKENEEQQRTRENGREMFNKMLEVGSKTMLLLQTRRKQKEALGKQSGSVCLLKQTSFSAELQVMAMEMQKTLLHSNFKEVTLESESDNAEEGGA